MDFNEYQSNAQKTAKFIRTPLSLREFPTADVNTNDIIESAFDFSNLSYTLLGLSGEVGEICNKVKKVWRDELGIISEEHERMLADELGDVLWYVAAFASVLGVDLNDVAQANIDKLKSRMERGVIGGSGDNR